jgi:hypothetical protein
VRPKLSLNVTTHGLREVNFSVRLHFVVLEVLCKVDCRVLFVLVGLLTLPHVNVATHVEDKAVRMVHQLCLHLDWEDSGVMITVNAHQLWHVFGCNIVFEAAIATTVQVLDTTRET